jgi:hypothetical protein
MLVVLDDLALYPVVLANRGIRVAALGAALAALVERVLPAPSAAYVGLFAGELAHRGRAFRHFQLPTLEEAI